MNMEWLQNYLFQIIVTTLVSGVMAYINLKIKRMNKQVKEVYKQYNATNLGVQALLRDRLISAIHKVKKQQFVYVFELENINKMYAEYVNLGGNGTIVHMMNEVSKLPTKTDINEN